jgi:hypothetical protein
MVEFLIGFIVGRFTNKGGNADNTPGLVLPEVSGALLVKLLGCVCFASFLLAAFPWEWHAGSSMGAWVQAHRTMLLVAGGIGALLAPALLFATR